MWDKFVDVVMKLLGRGVKEVEDRAAAQRAESEEIHQKVQATAEAAAKEEPKP